MQPDFDQQADSRMQLADNRLGHIPDLRFKGERLQKLQQLMELHPAELVDIPFPDRNLQPLLLKPGAAAFRTDFLNHAVLDKGWFKCLCRG
ncbi:hypothetical protein D3C86_2064910 [compost metagenome]